MDMEKEMREEGERSTMIEELPEGCIAHIVSFTTPVDACKLSPVSKSFSFATESDVVWDHFLPSDLHKIISDSDYASLLTTYPSKKSLFLALSDHPIIIDSGKKSFQLEKQTGKKCYMLSARDLSITWIDDPLCWSWINVPESRFKEVAILEGLWWFEIRGKMNTHVLSPNTWYTVFLVFKMMNNALGFDDPFELSIGRHGGQMDTKSVWLGLNDTKMRSDGWLEIEMGEFFNSGIEDEEVEMIVLEIKSGHLKFGLLLEGIEVRPKKFE